VKGVARLYKDGVLVKEETIQSHDPFVELAQGTGARAKVSLGTDLTPGAGMKIFVHLSLECDQSEPRIDRAAELAASKILELADGFIDYIQRMAPQEKAP